MKKIFLVLPFLLLAFLFLAAPAFAATYTAASCSQAHVQRVMNSARASGDVVVIPACGATSWTTSATWAAPANASLHCAGGTSVRGGDDSSIIVDNYASSRALFSITGITGTFEMYGCTFQQGTGTVKDSPAILNLTGTSTKFKFHHNHVNMTTGTPNNGNAIRVINLEGVMYENKFTQNANGTGNGIKLAGDGEGDAAWAAATAFGTSDFLFIEDNTFVTVASGGMYAAANDCDHGGKYVWRFNINAGSSVQTHPTGGSGVSARGCRASEIYANSFIGDNAHQGQQVHFLSSGSALNWGNYAPSGMKNYITLHSMRRNANTYRESATPNGWGYCGTSFNGTGSKWDENTSTSTGKRCLDQPGNGAGDLLKGTPPKKVNSRTGTIAWPEQALEPFYSFMNIYACSGCDQHVYLANYEADAMPENETWYRPVGATGDGGGIQTTSSSPFNGTVGTGWGTLARRPSTCTSGVAYFVTDASGGWNSGTNALYTGNGQLYKCTATNTWTLYYTPYTYPHPLRS